MSRSQANFRGQQTTIRSKSYAPRCQLLHHQAKAVKEPPSPLQTTVSYGIILSHGHKSTALSAKRQFNTSILYTTKLQIHRFKTRAVFAIAPSTCATFSLHRAAAALLASVASWRALTSGMKSLLSRRNISRSTLPGEIELHAGLPVQAQAPLDLISHMSRCRCLAGSSRRWCLTLPFPRTRGTTRQRAGCSLRHSAWSEV